jgi:hypothetical protein
MSDKHVKVGPPVDERVDDGRKHDHLGPNPEHEPELEKRAKHLSEVHAKLVEAPESPKSSGTKGAQTK